MEFENVKQIEAVMKDREVFNHVFGTREGKAVLTAILNRLGFFSIDPKKVYPECVVVANWLLARMGVLTVDNLPKYVAGIVDTASNEDLRLAQTEAKQEDEEEETTSV